MKTPSLCFVSPQALPMLLDAAGSRAAEASGGMGGSELQQVLIGRELAIRGLEITFVVGRDRLPGPPAAIDGMRIIACPLGSAGDGKRRGESILAKARRVAGDARLLYRAMADSRADVYSVRSNHLVAVLVSAWCRFHGKRFIFAAGHDGNCDLSLSHRRPHGAVKLTYTSALRGAAAVVVQSENQKRMMLRRLGVASRVIPNAIALDRPAGGGSRSGVLWIGTIEPRKGPDRLLDIAASMHDVEFTMVGGEGDPRHHDYYLRCRSRAEGLSNVRWLGPRPHREALDLISRSEMLLCTSRSEGFPNTFLESWSLGTPIVSMEVNPDDMLSRLGAGVLSGGQDGTAGAIRDLLRSSGRRDSMAGRARAHVERHHALGSVADQWKTLLSVVA